MGEHLTRADTDKAEAEGRAAAVLLLLLLLGVCWSRLSSKNRRQATGQPRLKSQVLQIGKRLFVLYPTAGNHRYLSQRITYWIIMIGKPLFTASYVGFSLFSIAWKKYRMGGQLELRLFTSTKRGFEVAFGAFGAFWFQAAECVW